MKILLTLLLSLALLMSCENQSTHSEDTGSIEGKVVFAEGIYKTKSSGEPVVYAQVRIAGTSAYAYTDSAGKYLIYGLPEGIYDIDAYFYGYDLYVSGKLRNIVVHAGSRTQAPDIILSSRDNVRYTLKNLSIQNDEGQRWYFDASEKLSDSKQVTVSGILRKNSPNYSYPDTSITLKLNSKSYELTTSKGWFSKAVALAEGENSFKIWLGHGAEPATVLAETKLYYLTSINKVKIRLNWNSYGGDAGDFDIHLTNELTHDVCWYNNPNPDWGLPAVDYDDPWLEDEINSYGNSYGYEYLKMNSAANGAYTLKVVYFANHTEPDKKIKPEVQVTLKGDHTQTYVAPTDMSVGDEWTVCSFQFPLTTAKALNLIGKADVQNMPPKRATKKLSEK